MEWNLSTIAIELGLLGVPICNSILYKFKSSFISSLLNSVPESQLIFLGIPYILKYLIKALTTSGVLRLGINIAWPNLLKASTVVK